ncbi:MAG: branched-chain amino acid ABC transporter permease [Acidothermus sp.]|nr:branched-chain amino acid ABC transporter permease [Acidothermus sp.]
MTRRDLRSVLTGVRARQLGTAVLGALVVDVMTGPSGSLTAPTRGLTGSLLSIRAVIFVALGVALWAFLTFRDRLATYTSRWTAAIAPSRLVADRRYRRAGYAALLAAAIAVPPYLSQYWQEVAVDQIGVYVLLALGLNVVVGFAGLLDLGYIAFYAIGAYSCAYWTGSLPIRPPHVFNPFVTIIFAVIAAMIAGVVLGFPTLRLRGDYLAIVTLGFGEIITIYANNLQSVTGGAQGPPKPIPHFSINLLGIHYQWKISNLPYYYLLLAFVVLILVLFHNLENSRVGRAWTAIREDEVAAAASGINTFRYKLLAFAIGASTSGFAGVLFASKIQVITPLSFVLQQSILVLVLVIFGGMGSLAGAVVGAAVIQWLPNALKTYVDKADLFMYLGAVLVVMMIYRPQGIIPSRRRSRELAMAEAGLVEADALTTASKEV